MRKTGLPAVSEPPLEASDRVSFSPKKGLLAAKKRFYADLFSFFGGQWYRVVEQSQKLCKSAKKVIAPFGFDDYYK